jgi:hypothetical protein
METSLNTVAGLREYFFDDIFSANPSHYKHRDQAFTHEQFEQQLTEYRESMNEYRGCKFPRVGQRTESRWYKQYLATREMHAGYWALFRV